MSKRILITGGAGFIAHHAIKYYLENTDWEIVSLDRLDLAGLIAGLCLLPAIAVDAGLAEICLCCGGCLAAAVLFATIESFPAGSAGRSFPCGRER